MDPFHERLARTGLAAADRYGFALAGGYAVQAAGLVERPSEDVDLFTAWDRRDEFTAAVVAVVHAYRGDGLTVETERQYDTFARLAVTDGVRASKVELGVDWRANDPILMAIGPVLHPDDAVANKMSALYGRAFARDFIDIDATLRSGRYTRDALVALVALAQRADRGFDPRIFADALGQANELDPDDFAQYGVTGPALDDLRSRFAEWRRDLLDDEEG
ncbi:nucleotidyl transferase AbiEii/AbiGii toxin family protein [Micromonospora sp. NPDC005979]|uniref:nucleotidyl transferase AbiEii/AbiGii toxin family protein n=1 Tax=Micromonospora sp. NPDC005979 TaxID=3156726 RepID=UPI0033A682DE